MKLTEKTFVVEWAHEGTYAVPHIKHCGLFSCRDLGPFIMTKPVHWEVFKRSSKAEIAELDRRVLTAYFKRKNEK